MTSKYKSFDANNSFNCSLGKRTCLGKVTETLYLKKYHFEKAEKAFPSLSS